MFMQKRTQRVIEGADSIVKSLVPQAFSEEGDGSDVGELPYVIIYTVNGDHIVIDVHVKDKVTSGQLIGRNGAAVKTVRRVLEIIANQEGLRITFDIVPPKRKCQDN